MMERQLPDLSSALAREIQSGMTLLGAFTHLSESLEEPLRGDLVDLTRLVASGVRMEDALSNWQHRWSSSDLDLLVAACRFGFSEGGDLSSALDGVSVALLDRIELADEARALSSQARTSAGVLIALPIAGVLGFSLLDPAVAQLLLTTPTGWACLILGLLLNGLGAWATLAIVRRSLR